MEKFRGKYRVPSARWANWDYGRNAAYFVTICTLQRDHAFGHIVEGTMTMTTLGQIAAACWQEIPDHFPFVVLDEFVVMPNHIHGILAINKVESDQIVETQDFASLPLPSQASVPTPAAAAVETQDLASLQPPASLLPNRFGPQSQNLASIVRGYKIGVTKYARQNEIPFAWQARYHDHVIRNSGEYDRIRQYIRTNVQHWPEDTYFAQVPTIVGPPRDNP